MARFINQALFACFNRWLQWYEDVLAQQQAARRALYSWNANGLMWGFTWWRVGRHDSVLDLHSKAAAFWLNREMGMAFATWSEQYQQYMSMSALLRRLEERHQREKEALLLEIERLRKLIMDREMRREIEFDDDDRKLNHALKMMMNRSMAMAYQKLKYEVQLAQDNADSARHVLGHLRNRQISKGYNTWRETYFSLLAMRRALGYMVHRQISAAWNTWVAYLEDIHRQGLAMRNAVLRWQQQFLYSAFNAWRQVLRDSMHDKNTMLRAILRWGGSELLSSFGYWRETAEKIRVAELEFRAYLTKSYDQS
eukprot:TRINITY_DN18955_c0_g1_i5.p1 TRINITY_DN18955_c0_g1~~TRINITY_DN18955_c0_g1_i5.p1  ORF type:complete len:310 (-),score=93.50 TRINITY_DN18955_c0_g1_i5:141-1070(-)